MKKRCFLLVCFLFIFILIFVGCDEHNEPFASDSTTPPEEPLHVVENPEPNENIPVESAELLTYKKAVALLEKGKIQDAYDLFLTIKDMYDVPDRLKCFSFKCDAVISYTPLRSYVRCFEYDSYGNKTSAVEFSSGKMLFTENYEYDENGNIIEHRYTSNGCTPSVTSYKYDDLGNPIRKNMPDGSVALCEYDADGNMVRSINSDGSQWECVYDANGNILEEYRTDTNGIRTLTNLSEYNEQGKLKKHTTFYKDGKTVTTYQYNEKGYLIKRNVEQSNGISYYDEYEYDEYGNKTKQGSYHSYWGEFSIFYWKYDEKGNITEHRREDEQGPDYSYYYEYDASGNRIKNTYVLHKSDITSVREYEYDAYGNLLKEIAGGETDSSTDYNITTYVGYKLYYNPNEGKTFPDRFGAKG